MPALKSIGAIWSKCCLRCLSTLPRNVPRGKQRCKHTHSLTLTPTCTTLTAFIRFPFIYNLLRPLAPSSTLSASLPPCLSLASPNSLQTYTHFQLFLLLSQSDLTGEHSCPAAIPPRGLFCFRPSPLSSQLLLFFPSLPIYPFLFPPLSQEMSHPMFPLGLVCLLFLFWLSPDLKGLSAPMTLGSVLSGALVAARISYRKLVPRELPDKDAYRKA